MTPADNEETTMDYAQAHDDPYGLLARWVDATERGDGDALESLTLVTRAVLAGHIQVTTVLDAAVRDGRRTASELAAAITDRDDPDTDDPRRQRP
jgi:hypothetical protein